ncbi:MAG: host attachment protein [Pseudomonadota bacterium]
MPSWILVADAGRARLFSATGRHAPLEEVDGFVNPEARVPARALERDRPMLTQQSATGGSTALGSRSDTAEQAARTFAGEICSYLDRGRNEGAYDDLVVIAPPKFLGYLRSAVKPRVNRMVSRSIAKDLTQAAPDAIRDAFRDW